MNINALQLLRCLIDIIYMYFLLVLSYMIYLSIKVLFIGNGFQDLAMESDSRLIAVTDVSSGTVYLLGVIAILMIFGILHYCRKSIIIWYKKDFFNSDVSRYLKIAGLLTLSSIALKKIPVLIYDHFNPEIIDDVFPVINKIDLSFGLESIVIAMIFGLFLLILSQVLAQARNLKNENDLTI
ncbi:DUF2975 domain-containing protein [Nonlabens sp.]|uniref:DUF2975 domain-containing protein n=1 Tax=Nonlabens sp. TaxID=1888209 RepID=UPI003F6A2902